jgi:Zn-dependent protease
MENYSQSSYEPLHENLALEEPQVIIPPKPPAEVPRSKANIWLRSATSLLLYLAIGYYFFHQNWTLVLVLTGVVVFHELGHFLAMKAYKYTDLGIFFIPLVGAYASGKKQEVSQMQSSVILLAGPVPGIILGLLLKFIAPYFTSDYYELNLLHSISMILIYLNLLNLLPIYPLDGGQLLNRLFLDNSQIISKIFLFLSIGIMIWFALFGMDRPFYALLIIPGYLLTRMVTDSQFDKLTQKVEDEGFDLNTTYEEISDEKYWKIRNILIRNHSSLKDVAETPPYEYSPKEEQIRTLMQNLLQRTIIQDISVGAKIIIILVWVGCFAAPFLANVPLSRF